jgi:hypothetical protein
MFTGNKKWFRRTKNGAFLQGAQNKSFDDQLVLKAIGKMVNPHFGKGSCDSDNPFPRISNTP